MRLVLVLTTLLLVLAVPLALGATTGRASGVSDAIAGLFGK